MAEGQSLEEEGSVGQRHQYQQQQPQREVSSQQLKPKQQVLSVQHFQAPAPSNVIATVVPDSASSTTKEEEWVTKKKVELTTKRQIETRVKRQVVLEDGRVVEDSGPIVTTNTTEDTEKQESTTTEKRDLAGDGEGEKNGVDHGNGRDRDRDGDEWLPATPGTGTLALQDGLLREVKEKKVCSRQETSELLETEDVQHLGDISDQDYQKAVESRRNDLRQTLERCKRDNDSRRFRQLHQLHDSPGRVVHRSTKSRKVVDSEDSQRLHALGPDGKMVTETRTTTEHEEIEGEEQPDSGSGSSTAEEEHKESPTQFARTKQQQLVDYYLGHKRIGGEIKYESENFEGGRQGVPMEPADWDNLSARARAARAKQIMQDRKDALTRKPIDPDQEERTRKHETGRWLDSHFGSASGSSSRDEDDVDLADTKRPSTSSFINVTMKSSKSPVPDSSRQGVHLVMSPESPSRPIHHRSNLDIHQSTPTRHNQTNERFSYSRAHFDRSDLSPVEKTLPTVSDSTVWYSTVNRNNKYQRNGRVSSEEEAPSPSPPVRPRRRRMQESEHDSSRLLIENEQRWKQSNGHLQETAHAYSPTPTPSSDVDLNHQQRQLHENAAYRAYTPSPSEQRESPQPDAAKKKIFQRTRFAAEIPLVKPKPQGGSAEPKQSGGGLSLGRSLRKLVGKLGGGSRSSRSEAAQQQQAPPRGYQQHQQHSYQYQQPVQRYYLGEDPFSGSSIYGRESEYHSAAPRRRHSNRIPSSDGQNGGHYRGGTSTLGRLSRSTGRLASSAVDHQVSTSPRGASQVHTLPRKLHNGVSWQKQQTTTTTHSHHSNEGSSGGRLSDNRSGSLINVSIVNKPKPTPAPAPAFTSTSSLGPAKPARTYRANLLRSKSFSAQQANDGLSLSPGLHTSNPQLHRLHREDSPPPLKSPGIVTSISRRDASRDASRNLLVRRLIDRVPQLYDALHGNASNGNVGKPANGVHVGGNTANGYHVGNTANGVHLSNGVSNDHRGLTNSSSSMWTSTSTIENRYRSSGDRRNSSGGVVIEVRSGD